ncbi:putative sporulation protein YyaC [Oceanobacillus limi]|uniref:Putative sporulation protein YyaC n=1 Tax=Oceanobacillus limi TaxID=930131 RepID=A0A1I0D1L2_9BACI|nr:spore protease YyaC [Oceanobacillus limi]SET25317.1 putative sporulation protein YyaC [Oceanobacillus limi]
MNLKSHFQTKNDTIRMLYSEQRLCETISEKITSWLPNSPREYVVVCVGTDRSTGDALGPLTGSYLEEHKPRHLSVYGTLHDPVHATNLQEKLDLIYEKHRNPYIIAVDACLGKKNSVGQVIASQGALKPGAALNKTLPNVGEIHITGVVNISGFMEYSVLQNTRLSLVVEMAKQIAGSLDLIDQKLAYNRISPAVVIQQVKEKLL